VANRGKILFFFGGTIVSNSPSDSTQHEESVLNARWAYVLSDFFVILASSLSSITLIFAKTPA
jgi:hypothetical protein